ncbi:MAG: phosphate-starvation-inducible PsiE family protein [Methanomicrobiaceae archaeon]|nr:phosphate-starvation-inducible PsiE family protein [Methanomicrobiaceae archaeon]
MNDTTSIVRVISSVGIIFYLTIAAVLMVLTVIAFYDVALSIIALSTQPSITDGILGVLHALFVPIILIEILETVLAYFRTSTFQLAPILVAGITAMVRRVLLFGVETVDPIEMVITLAAIGVLTFAVVYISRDDQMRRGK